LKATLAVIKKQFSPRLAGMKATENFPSPGGRG
jgi:hypothetical protein